MKGFVFDEIHKKDRNEGKGIYFYGSQKTNETKEKIISLWK